MMLSKEKLARLRRRLETWPDDRPSPISINTGLELLDMVDRLEKEADWLAEKICKYGTCVYSTNKCHPDSKQCIECWRKAARKAVDEQCEDS